MDWLACEELLASDAKPTTLDDAELHSGEWPGGVACDFCTDKKIKPVKFCLDCDASFCLTHIKQHYILRALQEHTLVEAAGNLKPALCQQHHRALELYCNTDSMLICNLCLENHRGHDVVSEEQRESEQLRQEHVKPVGLTVDMALLRLHQKEPHVMNQIPFVKPAFQLQLPIEGSLSTATPDYINKYPADFIFSRTENNKNIYILKMNIKKDGIFSKHTFGPSAQIKQNKTILLVGATGSGKSTLINAMINYILGVKWEDPHRFELIPKETEATQAHSQTSKVTAYQINHREGFGVPFSLTLIDTPGFGDTQGISRDQEITKNIKEFFSSSDGIDSIDAVGFVIQSASARLTHTQKYIFDSILAIFGKDIAENIVILVTFSDGEQPPALAAINEANVPCARKEDGSRLFFKFNNSALFSGIDSPFGNTLWKMGLKNMEKTFENLYQMVTRSLQLTKEVLDERENLEAIVDGLLLKIKVGLMKADESKGIAEALERHKEAAEENKNFEYEVNTTKMTKQNLKPGIRVTNCTICNFTCHKSCRYANQKDKYKCRAMKKGKCTVCKKKCHWSFHRNMRYRIVYKTVKNKGTYNDLKKKYEDAHGKFLSAEKVLSCLRNEYASIQDDILDLIQELSKTQKRLGEIALRPMPLTATDYIDLMIKSEEQAGEDGFKARIHQLNEVKKKAEILEKVSRGESLLQENLALGRWNK